jgi:hypothetical protein
MSIEAIESPEAPEGIPADEWSSLERLLKDRWPNGKPRPWYPAAMELLRIAATISIVASAAIFVAGVIANAVSKIPLPLSPSGDFFPPHLG